MLYTIFCNVSKHLSLKTQLEEKKSNFGTIKSCRKVTAPTPIRKKKSSKSLRTLLIHRDNHPSPRFIAMEKERERERERERDRDRDRETERDRERQRERER